MPDGVARELAQDVQLTVGILDCPAVRGRSENQTDVPTDRAPLIDALKYELRERTVKAPVSYPWPTVPSSGVITYLLPWWSARRVRAASA